MPGLKLNHVSKRGHRWQSIIFTNDGLGYGRIYASHGLTALMCLNITSTSRIYIHLEISYNFRFLQPFQCIHMCIVCYMNPNYFLDYANQGWFLSDVYRPSKYCNRSATKVAIHRCHQVSTEAGRFITFPIQILQVFQELCWHGLMPRLVFLWGVPLVDAALGKPCGTL